jgi:hypothetical protein
MEAPPAGGSRRWDQEVDGREGGKQEPEGAG